MKSLEDQLADRGIDPTSKDGKRIMKKLEFLSSVPSDNLDFTIIQIEKEKDPNYKSNYNYRRQNDPGYSLLKRKNYSE